MIIDLKTISHGIRSFEFFLAEDWWQSNDGYDRILGIETPFEVKIKIYRAGERYVLEGALAGRLQILCDRCLEHYKRELKSKFRVFLALPLSDTEKSEIELTDEDLEIGFISGEEIDLDDIIRERIYLSLPIRSICDKSCLGLCPICGINLNGNNCRCHKEQGHPGFKKLQNLKMKEMTNK